ncbi:Uncharacterised protein [Rhodococcus wratislaviensis]|uniref:Uncharacterized protein n=1 Tax=Rhodococcus wratislaviensis TaxID=44752 RepID=A0AB38F8P2_RHOWR|nr:Uncharacterised protein [Rhodococcus wratislaviensis]
MPIDDHVVVGVRDDVAGGRRQSGVACPGQPRERLTDQAHPRIRETEDVLPGGVGSGGVVDDEYVERRIVHREDGSEGRSQHRHPVAGAYDDRHRHGIALGHASRTGPHRAVRLGDPQSRDSAPELAEIHGTLRHLDLDEPERASVGADEQSRPAVALRARQPAADRNSRRTPGPVGVLDRADPHFAYPNRTVPVRPLGTVQGGAESESGCGGIHQDLPVCSRMAALP